MTDREKFSYTYDPVAEGSTLLIDAEDVRRHVEGLRWNAAAGASGMTNKELMALIVGPEGKVNLDGYEGDNKFPVEESVHIWGEKFLDKKFGREVKKIVEEVAPALRSMS